MFRYLILGLLRTGTTLHGYALVKAYRERSGADVSTGNFYRELQRLVMDGLIRGADNPPGADARRTPYAITAVGGEVFDEWLAAADAGAAGFAEDELSARALFLEDCAPAACAAVLDHLQENLWFVGKTLERTRQQALTRAASPGGDAAAILPLLLTRRLKHLAANLEFAEEVRIVLAAARVRAEPTHAAPRPAATIERGRPLAATRAAAARRR